MAISITDEVRLCNQILPRKIIESHDRLLGELRCSLVNVCTVSVQDAPVESAESQWILKTETVTTLSSLVKVIKEPWEAQFGVELQKNLYPSITVRLEINCYLL